MKKKEELKCGRIVWKSKTELWKNRMEKEKYNCGEIDWIGKNEIIKENRIKRKKTIIMEGLHEKQRRI